MIILLLLGAALGWALIRGGKISNLGYASFFGSELILVGFLTQAVIFSPLWGNEPILRPYTSTFYLISLEMLLVALAANFRLPGMWLLTLGFGLNFAAIAVNGGYMPASQFALEAAGLPVLLPGETLTNSIGMSTDTPLAFLGDIFAIPQSWFLANVFSLGDLVIGAGAARLIYGLTVPPAAANISEGLQSIENAKA
jgi:hypothetical protein